MRFLKCIILFISILIFFPLYAGDVLTGSWIVSGSTYSHIFTFDSNGECEQRIMVRDTETITWSGKGHYKMFEGNIKIQLDETSSNSPVNLSFEIISITPGVITLAYKKETLIGISTTDSTISLIRLSPSIRAVR